jgi:cell pole-organizing protein PopZ
MMGAALSSLISASSAPTTLDMYARPVQPAAEPARDYGAAYNGSYARQPYVDPDPVAAASAAFDALAQGLARSAPVEPPRIYDYYPTAARSTQTALVAQPLVPAVQEYHPQAIRTLEDAVAEMLKPMLQKWLADNMPRIIERALRVEAASGIKSHGQS